VVFWFILLSIFCYGADRPYVIGCPGAQLGNQLFQVASVLAYAWDHDFDPIFPCLKNRTDQEAIEWRLAEHRDTIFSFLNLADPPRPHKHFYLDRPFTSAPLPVREDQIIIGNLQSVAYFHHYRDRFLALFKPSAEILHYLERKYGPLLAAHNTVSVHVRTYDEFYHYRAGCYFLGLSYYKKAFNHFPEDSIFVVFSDRINWCKHHFAAINKNFVFIEGNDEQHDLFLMAKMNSHILSNSSYAWWGAYLDPNPDRVVVAPSHWYHPRFHTPEERHRLPGWILVTPNFDEPYPADIRKYDQRSLSVDNQ
jgi:hypothetical protein